MKEKAMDKVSSKSKLLQSALLVIREKGYSATTVDDLCAHAGVSKGAFFHNFTSKEALAVEAANFWTDITTDLFNKADYQKVRDPLARLKAYIDLRIELVKGPMEEVTCLVGTMVQETYHTNDAIREACRSSIYGHANDLAKTIAEARALYAPKAKWSAESLALHTQAVIQGAYILAKASDGIEVAVETMNHLKNYIDLLFEKTTAATEEKK